MKGHARIVGGGIAGLAVGGALLRRGWSVEIRERSGPEETAGTALGMWPAAMAALTRLGVADEVRRVGEHCGAMHLLTPDGRPLARVGPRGSTYLLSRGALLSALRSTVPEGDVAWRTPVTGEEPEDGADVVIGADGIHSTVRRTLWPGDGTRPLGSFALRGTVPGRVDRLTETWGRGRLFGVTPQNDGRTNWFACVRGVPLPVRGEGDDPAELLRELFGSWHPGVAAVVERIEAEGVDCRELRDVAPLRRFAHGNAVLIGDAAHAMAPNLGRGACEALIDAVSLADALDAAPTVEAGLSRYDGERRRRSQRVVRLARVTNRVATLRRGTRVRDGLVRLTAPRGRS